MAATPEEIERICAQWQGTVPKGTSLGLREVFVAGFLTGEASRPDRMTEANPGAGIIRQQLRDIIDGANRALGELGEFHFAIPDAPPSPVPAPPPRESILEATSNERLARSIVNKFERDHAANFGDLTIEIRDALDAKDRKASPPRESEERENVDEQTAFVVSGGRKPAWPGVRDDFLPLSSETPADEGGEDEGWWTAGEWADLKRIITDQTADKAGAEAIFDAVLKFAAKAEAGSRPLAPEAGLAEEIETPVVWIDYTNWRGERAWRSIVPLEIGYGSSRWHPDAQYLLTAKDVDKGERRDFALNSIHGWSDTQPQSRPDPASEGLLREALVVTPKMEGAGAQIIYNLSGRLTTPDLAAAVYRAMARLRTTQPQPAPSAREGK